jgi:hypothetical protein
MMMVTETDISPSPKKREGEVHYYLITDVEVHKYFFNGAGITQEEQTNVGIRIVHRPYTTPSQRVKWVVRGIIRVIAGIYHALCELVDEINKPPEKKKPVKKA